MTGTQQSVLPPNQYDDGLGGAPDPEVVIAFLDVGQGDCTIAVDLLERRAVIIDCPSWGVAKVKDFVQDHDVTKFDSIIVTHYDDDHFSGVPQLVRDLKPKTLFSNPETLLPDDSSLPKYRAALSSFTDLDERGLVQVLQATRDLSQKAGAVTWTLLAPRYADVVRAIHSARPNRNVASAVVRLQVGSIVVLVGGDAPMRTWTRIYHDRHASLRANVFRTSHHGANMYGTNETIKAAALLQAIGATHVASSVGATNIYGHPGLHTIHASRLSGAQVFCTQVTGACLGVSDLEGRRAVASGRHDVNLPTNHACAGTVQVEFAGRYWRVTPSRANHAERVNGWPTPHCRQNCRPEGSSLETPSGCP